MGRLLAAAALTAALVMPVLPGCTTGPRHLDPPPRDKTLYLPDDTFSSEAFEASKRRIARAKGLLPAFEIYLGAEENRSCIYSLWSPATAKGYRKERGGVLLHKEDGSFELVELENEAYTEYMGISAAAMRGDKASLDEISEIFERDSQDTLSDTDYNSSVADAARAFRAMARGIAVDEGRREKAFDLFESHYAFSSYLTTRRKEFEQREDFFAGVHTHPEGSGASPPDLFESIRTPEVVVVFDPEKDNTMRIEVLIQYDVTTLGPYEMPAQQGAPAAKEGRD